MRNLTAGNKMKFTMFTFIVVIILALLICGVIIVLRTDKEKYEVESTAFIYDSDYNYIELENPALISKKWTGSYYLKENITKKEYKLGENVVAYDVNKKNVDLYGTFYQVLNGGEIKKIKGSNKVKSSSASSSFYKMADRKYLIISDTIGNDIGSLDAKDYLMIIIDKAGNALLLNNEMDIRTINGIKLITQDFTFDVANEKLIFNNEEINLKKIIGSTNEYVEKEKKNVEDNNTTNEENNTENSQVIVNGGGTSTTVENNQATIIGSEGDQESNRNKLASTLNKWSQNVKDAFNSVLNKKNKDNQEEDEEKESARSIELNGVTSASTFIDISYTVNDPDGKYNVVYAKVYKGNELIQSVSLDKNGTSYRVQDLIPDTNYSVEIGYRIVYSDAATVDTVEDSMPVKTLKQTEKLSFIKITSEKIYYNLKIDGNYIYGENSSNKPILRVYLNDSFDCVQEITMNTAKINTAVTTQGYTGYIDNTDEIKQADYITIKLENTYYNNNKVETNLKAKIKNYKY